MAIAMARLLGNRQKMASFSGLMLQVHSRKSTAGVLNTKSSGDNSSPYDVKMLSKQNKLKEALYILRAMEKPVDYSTYAYLLQACTDNKSLANGKLVHAYMTEMGFMTDRFFLNTLLNMYAKCGSSMDARRVFDQIPERNVFSWTLMIAAYARHGFAEESLTLFHRMQRTGIQPDRFTFSSVLPACADLASLKDVHEEISRSGFQDDIFLGSVLIDMYAKRGDIENARHVFDKIPQRDVVLWNGMIAGYAQNGYVDEALQLFQKVPKPDLVTWNTMIAGYAQNGHLDEALQLFQKMPKPDVVSWTAMLAAYAQNGQGVEALKLFCQMQLIGIKPGLKTFASVLPACANLAALEQGKEIHEQIIRSGFQSDVFVGSALIDMYAKCGTIETARYIFDNLPQRDVVSWNTMIAGYVQIGHFDDALKLFQKMPERDVISWNAIIVGYAQNGNIDEALKLFHKMPERNVVSWTAMIGGYTQIGHLDEALQLFQKMPDRDVISWNVMIAGYAHNGRLHEAVQLFHKMPKRDGVSWNSMIAGYAQNGNAEEALKLFRQMQIAGVQPNSETFIIVLPVCANFAALEQGKEVHEVIIRSGFQFNVFVGSALVDMYAKCGSIEIARQEFDKMPQRNEVSWTAIIAGFAQNGRSEEALDLFVQMRLAGVKPNSKTFASVLPACANLASLKQGMEIHEEIIINGFQSDVFVGNALLDMYAKCGNIKNARRVFDKMPQRDVVSWNAMIAGYAQNGHVDEAQNLFKKMPEQDVISLNRRTKIDKFTESFV